MTIAVRDNTATFFHRPSSRVAWSNNYRLLESIGYIPLAGAEANYCRQLTDNTVDAI
ncbi:MAG TPA: hypothetical protein PK708_02270 [Candidatus Competibacter sp.]|nr:hypothetical protein [Candidatus Competibacter sp.]